MRAEGKSNLASVVGVIVVSVVLALVGAMLLTQGRKKKDAPLKSPVQVREDERSVEQEAGQDKEHGDATVHPGEKRAENVGTVRAAGERDVGHHDRECGEGAQPVEAREMAVGGSRRGLLPRWLRRSHRAGV